MRVAISYLIVVMACPALATAQTPTSSRESAKGPYMTAMQDAVIERTCASKGPSVSAKIIENYTPRWFRFLTADDKARIKAVADSKGKENIAFAGGVNNYCKALLPGYYKKQAILYAPGAQESSQPIRTAPKFADYPAIGTYLGVNRPIIIDSAFAKSYRTRLVQAAKAKPNFAGHYIVTTWGCGSGGCTTGAVIDANTGRVFPLPVSISSVAIVKQQYIKSDIAEDRDHTWRPNSRLMIFAGNLDGVSGEGLDTIAYYDFTGERFRLVKSEPWGRSE